MNPHLDLILSCLYDDCLAPEHPADLHKSSLTDETIQLQKIRAVAPHMIDQLLGFPTARCRSDDGHAGAPCDCPKVTSAYLIPFPDPRGGWMDHVRLKTFPEQAEVRGDHVTNTVSGTATTAGPASTCADARCLDCSSRWRR